jgi:sulfur-carrier protein
MRVRIPTPLRSYTGGEANVAADRFRVVDEQDRLREHMTVWLDGERCRDLATRLGDLDELVLMQALSGG